MKYMSISLAKVSLTLIFGGLGSMLIAPEAMVIPSAIVAIIDACGLLIELVRSDSY